MSAEATPALEVIDPGAYESVPVMSAQEAATIGRYEKEFDTRHEPINIADIIEFLEPENAEVADNLLLFKVPETASTLLDSKVPASVRQNGAILSVIYEIEEIAPQFLGYIMGSGRTWWFVTFEEAMEIDPDYVAGFAKGYVQEKLWQYTAF